MINVDHLSKRFGSREVLRSVSFTAEPGRVTGFVGPNGAGKSTVLKTIAGLISPDAGSVSVNGTGFADAVHPGRTMGVFLSAEWLPVQATAAGILNYVCRVQGLPLAWGKETLERVGLAEVAQHRVRTFSLGMRQRLGIAAATVGRPAVLVMDEPINGLDPDGIAWIRSFFTSAASEGATVLLSSHHMAELAEVADDIVMIADGRILGNGNVGDFVSQLDETGYYLESPNVGSLVSALVQRGFQVKRERAGVLVHHADPTTLASVAVESGAGISHLTRVTRTLEETYFEVLARNASGETQ
ncbi:ATP-binding cassette domain-containing protein [Paenarthrobacter sp. CM16]|uniref:ABC transporter ATP-binding protein n=1 Tax=Paenarthrobacter sp. CM16 TaxID=2738447 RepID=UPI00155569E9|nr:ATP-binding cassette domain-containing protein [Paenarthrobacter sp. CM16]NQD89253.1 ATP-binding cassette domain-containing protein [Paenarthrobacter sp. CM16]